MSGAAGREPKMKTTKRWTGSCRRERLDHLIVLSGSLASSDQNCITYYQADRIHKSLAKVAPSDATCFFQAEPI